jgi:hypothetical protein
VYELLYMRFELVIGFIELMTSNYSAIANSHTLQFTTARTKTFQSAVSSPVVAWQRLPTAGFPLTVGSRTIPSLSYQLLTATAHNG